MVDIKDLKPKNKSNDDSFLKKIVDSATYDPSSAFGLNQSMKLNNQLHELAREKEKKKWDYNEEMKEYAKLSAISSEKSAIQAEKAKFWSIVSVVVVVSIFLLNLIIDNFEIFTKHL